LFCRQLAGAAGRQVVTHFILEGDASTLEIFTPELVLGLQDDQFESIAGDEIGTRNQRSVLETDIKNLEAAMKVLRD